MNIMSRTHIVNSFFYGRLPFSFPQLTASFGEERSEVQGILFHHRIQRKSNLDYSTEPKWLVCYIKGTSISC